MDVCQFAGARWWKFDFHTHTPASDFRDDVTPECWLKAFMEKEIDCVAITDHNSGGWVDSLKQTLKELGESKPDWYRPLYLFPGVEISVSGNVHILAIFGIDKDRSHIDGLLGAVGYRDKKGNSEALTTKTVIEVVDEIVRWDGIAIPAHVDKKRGLFREFQGATLREVLQNQNIYASELRDCNYQKHQLYRDEKVQWAEINGSDTHSFSDSTFGTFTWIKMNEPSIDGLKLALIDGVPSINRNMQADPNQHAKCFVEELKIGKAKYIGHTKPLNCQFSPFLNTIIGGRGSGKSTLLEFMRLTLQRVEEIPKSLKKESHQYFSVGDDNLLTENSEISLIYRKGHVRYRLNWSAGVDFPDLEEEKNGNWEPCPGEIKSLFPVYIYSQKQIFEVANNPQSLINIIDDAPEVDFEIINAQRRELINEYKHIEQERLDLNEKIGQENQLRGKSNDLTRQIEQIEKSEHKEILQNYRERQQQLSELDNLEIQWKEMGDRLLNIRNYIVPARFNEQYFTKDADFLAFLRGTNEKWQVIGDKLNELAEEAQSVIIDWYSEKNAADWMWTLKADRKRYEQLRSQFEQQDIEPGEYPLLLKQLKHVQEELGRISEYQARREELEAEKRMVFDQIEKNRRTLTNNRRDFLSGVLRGNRSVSIEVKPFSENWDGMEKEIRRILQCPDRFDRDIGHLKEIYQNSGNEKIEKLKETVEAIRDGKKTARDVRFATHLQSLPRESIIDLILWFPGDDLKITFGPNHQRIEQGSPGQKTAALLAFILSYGDEPLLLDQPEDDLDNELIYKLIVEQLRETKDKRQVIVVTHNANIVVNGDAEMVLPLKFVRGETRLQGAASIQEKKVRDAICDILEGGQQAFEQRYKPIHLGD